VSRVAWVLNLDADLELGARGPYAPTAAVRVALRMRAEQLADALLGPHDVLVDERTPPGAAAGLPGRAFSPTPSAVALLLRAGAEPEPHPPVDVLRRVSSRAFSAELGDTLPESSFVTTVERAAEIVSVPPREGDAWRAKRSYSMAGRGHRVIAAGPLLGAELGFVRAGVEAHGGLVIEPNVRIELELAMHGLLGPSGALRVGALTIQRVDARGQWLGTERADEATHAEAARALRLEVERVGAALHAAGYFGPFGVDAFFWRDRSGVLRLRPRSEVNARHSMGFAVGLGRAARLGLP
jgi:hypothetical protein